MTFWPKQKHIKSHDSLKKCQIFLVLLLLLLELHSTPVLAIRANKIHPHPPSIVTATTTAATVPAFREAPAFRNEESCDSSQVKIAMTLDGNYIRGTVAAVLSILQHTSCPEDVTFYFISGDRRKKIPGILQSTFPYLNFRIVHFDSSHIHSLISPSIRRALDQPLNYARIYLADLIPEVDRVLYLDSDVIVVDDIRNLWEVDLAGKVVGAPEYCHTNFTKYFTDAFWSDTELSSTFDGRRPCYFNTGVMVVDLKLWRTGELTRKVEEWMMVQKKKRIYQLGSLPPFMLVLAGRIKAVDHQWNQHGLGGDNIEGKCRNLHPGKISLLHWSGKGKPWLRLDARKPCVVDYLWAPYDLYRSSTPTLEE